MATHPTPVSPVPAALPGLAGMPVGGARAFLTRPVELLYLLAPQDLPGSPCTWSCPGPGPGAGHSSEGPGSFRGGPGPRHRCAQRCWGVTIPEPPRPVNSRRTCATCSRKCSHAHTHTQRLCSAHLLIYLSRSNTHEFREMISNSSQDHMVHSSFLLLILKVRLGSLPCWACSLGRRPCR